MNVAEHVGGTGRRAPVAAEPLAVEEAVSEALVPVADEVEQDENPVLTDEIKMPAAPRRKRASVALCSAAVQLPPDLELRMGW